MSRSGAVSPRSSASYLLDPLVEQAHASGPDEQARDDEDDAKHNPTAQERHNARDDEDGSDDPKDQIGRSLSPASLSEQRQDRCHTHLLFRSGTYPGGVFQTAAAQRFTATVGPGFAL